MPKTTTLAVPLPELTMSTILDIVNEYDKVGLSHPQEP
jgi:hypothetical protein